MASTSEAFRGFLEPTHGEAKRRVHLFLLPHIGPTPHFAEVQSVSSFGRNQVVERSPFPGCGTVSVPRLWNGLRSQVVERSPDRSTLATEGLPACPQRETFGPYSWHGLGRPCHNRVISPISHREKQYPLWTMLHTDSHSARRSRSTTRSSTVKAQEKR